jgi:hypothetical protein
MLVFRGNGIVHAYSLTARGAIASPKLKEYIGLATNLLNERSLMRVLVLLLMISFPLLCNAEVYKWRDKDGNIHYSDTQPPTQTVQHKIVKNKTAKALTPEQQAAKDKADKAAAKTAACDGAKKNVATISDAKNTKITMDLNGDGKPEDITPEQRAAQTEVMKAAVTINCAQ